MNSFIRKTLPVANVHLGLLLLRTVAAAFMLTHGIPKLMQFFSDEPIKFADVFGMGPVVSLALVTFAEFLCSVFIFLGLFTRIAAIPLVVNMFVAAFYAHSTDPFSVKEMALLFLLIFTFLLLTGGGKYSIDGILLKQGRKKERRYI